MEFAELIRTPKLDGVQLYEQLKRESIDGTLCITGHHLILSTRREGARELWLLHQNVDIVERKPYINNNVLEGGTIILKCKDLRIIQLRINSPQEYFNVSNSIEQLSNLEKIKNRLFENLRMLPHAPGVQVQAIPEDAVNDESEDEDKVDKDERLPQTDKDKRIVPDNEFSDSEDEGEGGRRDNRSYKGGARKRPRLEKEPKAEEAKDELEVKAETTADKEETTSTKAGEDSKKETTATVA